jgi:hypothetical protein
VAWALTLFVVAAALVAASFAIDDPDLRLVLRGMAVAGAASAILDLIRRVRRTGGGDGGSDAGGLSSGGEGGSGNGGGAGA